jgi:hypothetical protein
MIDVMKGQDEQRAKKGGLGAKLELGDRSGTTHRPSFTPRI